MKSATSENVSGAFSNAQAQLLRAHVEREVRRSAIILVTSAQGGDGKSMTAFSLATSLARAGHRTALVGCAVRPRDDSQDCGPAMLATPLPEPGRFRETTADFLSSSRSNYDYTIVDTAPLLIDPLALALVGNVDGVILTVRVGRAPSDDDESTVRIIEQSNGRVIGVVAALPDAIDQFANRPSEVPSESVLRGARSPITAMKSLQSLFVGMIVLIASSMLALSGVAAKASHQAYNAATSSVTAPK